MNDQLEFNVEGKILESASTLNHKTTSEEEYAIVEENGSLSEFEEFNNALISGEGNRSIPAVQEQLNQYIDSMVEMMVKKQTSEPFKKGSASVAWNPDFILYKCRQDMTSAEQVLFDIVSGAVSSNPTQTSYTIDVTSIQEYLPYKDDSYAYKILCKASKSIQEKSLSFTIEYEGQEVEFAYPYFDPIAYVDTKKSRTHNAYISFIPSKILKMFLVSASVAHGGFYQISGAAKISGKNSKLLYYLLESRKNYCEYPGARPGVFRISLDDLRMIIGYPESYRYADIKRNILDPTKEDVKKIPEIDFVFDYKIYKSRKDGKKLQVTDLDFIIAKKAKLVEEEIEEEQRSEEDRLMDGVLKGFGYTKTQCRTIANACKENERDTAFLTKALVAVENANNVRSKVALLHYYISNGMEEKSKDGRDFDFTDRSYDYAELERTIAQTSDMEKAQ
jgi:plasmid replication initiation protein